MIMTNIDRIKANVKKSNKVQQETAEYYVADYDEAEDILYLYLREPEPCYSYPTDDDIWADFNDKDALLGYTITNASKYDLGYLFDKVHDTKFVWDIQRFLSLVFTGKDLVAWIIN